MYKRHAANQLSIPLTYLPNYHHLRQEDCLIDVTLLVDNKTIPAHRLVLSASSPYFKAMFNTTGLSESTKHVIELKCLNGNAVEEIINYFYTSKTPSLNQENFENILQAASYLLVEDIKDLCCSYMVDTIEPSNCWAYRSIAQIHSCYKLKNFTDSFIRINFSEFMTTEDFVKMSLEDVEEIILDDELYVESEEVVLEGVKTWVGYYLGHRVQYLGRLLRAVRLPLLKEDYLERLVRTDAMVRRDEAGVAWVREAIVKLQEGRREEVRGNFVRREEIIFAADSNYGYAIGTTSNFQLLKSSSFYTPICHTAHIGGVVYVLEETDFLRVLRAYNLLTNRWSVLLSTCEVALRAYALVALCADLYVMHVCKAGSQDDTLVIRYNPKDDGQSSPVAGLPGFNSSTQYVTMDGFIYALASDCRLQDGTLPSSVHRKRVARYDPCSDRWTAMARRRNLRKRMAVGVFEGELYVVGGNWRGAKRYGEKYNPTTNRWYPIADISAVQEYHSRLVVLNSHLYCVGYPQVNNAGNYSDQLCSQRYDKQTNCWTLTDDVKLPLNIADNGTRDISLVVIPTPVTFDPHNDSQLWCETESCTDEELELI